MTKGSGTSDPRPLRAAMNLGNSALVQVSADGTINGPAVDLVQRIGAASGRPTELIGYPDAASILKNSQRSEWDIALIARAPDRIDSLAFSMPYSSVAVCYAAREHDWFRHARDVDLQGVRVASARGTGYDAMLRRELQHAAIISFESIAQSFDRFLSGEADCAACVREGLIGALAGVEGVRFLDGHAGRIEQAVAVAGGASSLLPMINAVIEEVLERKVARL